MIFQIIITIVACICFVLLEVAFISMISRHKLWNSFGVVFSFGCMSLLFLYILIKGVITTINMVV